MADNFAAAKKTARDAADDLDGVRAGKSRAARLDPGRDASAANLAKVKRAGAGPWATSGDDVFGASTPASAKRTS